MGQGVGDETTLRPCVIQLLVVKCWSSHKNSEKWADESDPNWNSRMLGDRLLNQTQRYDWSPLNEGLWQEEREKKEISLSQRWRIIHWWREIVCSCLTIIESELHSLSSLLLNLDSESQKVRRREMFPFSLINHSIITWKHEQVLFSYSDSRRRRGLADGMFLLHTVLSQSFLIL